MHIKIVLNAYLKQTTEMLLSQFYYKVDKNKRSFFFHAVCIVAILLWKYRKKNDVREK